MNYKIVLRITDRYDNVLTCDLRIENLYNAVVEFIKFYNDQNK